MENMDLFVKVPEGYDCDQVNQYIIMLKAEYKKVFDYAKGVEANNEKLKNICRSLSEENKALKANGATTASVANNAQAVAKIEALADEIKAAAAQLG